MTDKMTDKKICRACKKPKLHFEYARNGKLTGGRKTTCMECLNAKARERTKIKRQQREIVEKAIECEQAAHNAIISLWRGVRHYPVVSLIKGSN